MLPSEGRSDQVPTTVTRSRWRPFPQPRPCVGRLVLPSEELFYPLSTDPDLPLETFSMPASLPPNAISSPILPDSVTFADDTADSPSRAAFSRASNIAVASSSASASASGSASVAVSAGNNAPEDFEMEPIGGHRRRKSSLLSPSGLPPSLPSPGRRRSQSLRNQTNGLLEDDNIIEEDDVANGFGGNGKDEHPRDSFSDEDLHDDEETGLTDPDRRRRQKKRRRNTLLDQRIAREKSLSADERKDVDKSVVRTLLTNALLIGLWYLFSLSISLVRSPLVASICMSSHEPIG